MNYKPCSEGSGEDHSYDIIPEPINYVEQNGSLEILIECVWGNFGRGRELVALESLLIDY